MFTGTVLSSTWHCLWLNDHSEKEPVRYAWPQNDTSPWTQQRRNQDDSSSETLFTWSVKLQSHGRELGGVFNPTCSAGFSNAIIHIQCTSQWYLDPAPVHVRKVKSSPRFCCCWLFNLEAIYWAYSVTSFHSVVGKH